MRIFLFLKLPCDIINKHINKHEHQQTFKSTALCLLWGLLRVRRANVRQDLLERIIAKLQSPHELHQVAVEQRRRCSALLLVPGFNLHPRARAPVTGSTKFSEWLTARC